MAITSTHTKEFLEQHKEVLDKAEHALKDLTAVLRVGGFSIYGCGCCGSPGVCVGETCIDDVNVDADKASCELIVGGQRVKFKL